MHCISRMCSVSSLSFSTGGISVSHVCYVFLYQLPSFLLFTISVVIFFSLAIFILIQTRTCIHANTKLIHVKLYHVCNRNHQLISTQSILWRNSDLTLLLDEFGVKGKLKNQYYISYFFCSGNLITLLLQFFFECTDFAFSCLSFIHRFLKSTIHCFQLFS